MTIRQFGSLVINREAIVDAKDQILGAAEALFARFGYYKTTVAEIARDSGIAKGSVYLHFDSKDDIFTELIERRMKRLLISLEKDVNQDGHPGMVLTEALNRFMDEVMEVKTDFKIDAMELDGMVIKKAMDLHRQTRPQLMEIISVPLKNAGDHLLGSIKTDDLAWLIAETFTNILVRTGPDPSFDWQRYVTLLLSSHQPLIQTTTE